MLIDSESLWAHLSSQSFYSAIAPLVLGGITYFTQWLGNQDKLRDRTNLRRDVLLDGINKRLQQLLARTLSADFELKDLRGAPPGEPDLIADYTDEFAQSLATLTRLFRIYNCIRACYTLFLMTAVMAFVGLLVGILFEDARPYVAIVSYLLIVFYIVLVFMVRRWMGRFEECERMS